MTLSLRSTSGSSSSLSSVLSLSDYSPPPRDKAVIDKMNAHHTGKRGKDHREKILALWKAGWSAARIGIELHITRNMVIGQVQRMKSNGIDVSRKNMTEHQRKSARGGAVKHFNHVSKTLGREKPSVAPLVPLPVKPVTLAPVPPLKPKKGRWVPFLKLSRNGCKYPRGDHKHSYEFCNEPRQDGSAYCEEHKQLTTKVITS
jgi:hypothetical protein